MVNNKVINIETNSQNTDGRFGKFMREMLNFVAKFSSLQLSGSKI